MGTLDGHDLPVTGIAYSPTGQHLATTAADGIKLWDAATGALLTDLIENDVPLHVRLGWYTDVAFSPDGGTIAVSRADRTLTLVDVATGEIDEVRKLTGIPNGIEYSPDGTTIAAGSDRIASLLIALTGDTTVFIHGDRVDDVAYSPDGTLLATVSQDGKATVWDMTSDAIGGTVVYSIDAERLTFRAVDFSPSGDSFATGGDDGTIRIWDATDGSPLLTLQAHGGAVIELTYGPDSTRLASVSADGTAKLHILDIDELIELARSRLTRSFTEAECRQYLHQDTCNA
jgi:WD40 repeat protein